MFTIRSALSVLCVFLMLMISMERLFAAELMELVPNVNITVPTPLTVEETDLLIVQSQSDNDRLKNLRAGQSTDPFLIVLAVIGLLVIIVALMASAAPAEE